MGKNTVNDADKVSIETFVQNIGQKTHKTSVIKKDNNPSESKPFKSGFKVNTIKGVINHPILNIPAYTFEEDDSYVECRRCIIIEN